MAEKDGRTRRDSFPDKTGREVRVGDRIAYGHALGRCAGIRFGKVLSIESVVDWRGEERWSIRVRGVDDDWSHREMELCKPGTLQYPDRILLVNGLLPEPVERLLADA